MIKAFKNLMRLYDVDSYRACATSAMREARNGADLVESIRKKTGVDIELIDGREEASIIYGNHVEYASRMKRQCAYVDVGGGSTEISILSEGRMVSSQSYKIGTLRMLHETDDYVSSVLSQITADMQQAARNLGPTEMVGSGGNINKLYKLVHEKSASQILTAPELERIVDRLSGLTPQERMTQFKLKADRADVIVPAGIIFRTVRAPCQPDRFSCLCWDWPTVLSTACSCRPWHVRKSASGRLNGRPTLKRRLQLTLRFEKPAKAGPSGAERTAAHALCDFLERKAYGDKLFPYAFCFIRKERKGR